MKSIKLMARRRSQRASRCVRNRLRRRAVQRGTTLFVVLLLGLSCAGVAASAERTNIVFLLADDLGYGNVSSYGGDVPTPHIDSLARNGIRFTSGYMTAPVCNPSRHALMTGRYQQRWGKELNSQTVPPVGQQERRDLPLEETTIADALSKLGYRTGAFGKWQLSWRDGYHPLERGFDDFVGMVSGMSHLDPAWPHARVAPRFGTPRGDPNSGLFRGREPIERDVYLTDLLAREAVAFIERNRERPFFLYLPFYAVHAPIQATEEYYRRAPAYEDETRRVFAAMILGVDAAVGAVLDALRRAGLEEKTLVVFASDNGAMEQADVARVNNRPLTGHKRNLYEGGIRVPFLMQWKGRLEGGREYTSPVSSLDLLPTALAAAGEEELGPYRLDGVDLLPYLEGKRQGAPHDFLFWRSGPNAAVRHGAFKLLMTGSGLTRLYDVEEDPGERRDLSQKRPDLVEKMRRAFARWSEEMVAPRESSRQVETRFNGDVIDWHI